jgi:hypothetical protein
MAESQHEREHRGATLATGSENTRNQGLFNPNFRDCMHVERSESVAKP